MQELNGYIKLFRKLIRWGWYQDSVVKDLFLHCLICASYKDFEWMGMELKAGQFITGRKKLAEELGFSEQQIRTAIKKLESTGEITTKSTNRYSVITVVNWDNYQGDDTESNQESNFPITNKQPTDNQQITNNQPQLNNYNNIDNIREVEETARPREGEIQNGKIYVDDYNEWVPVEVPENLRSIYRTLYASGTIDEYGNYINED